MKRSSGGSDLRFRIEHAQVTNPLQVAKFKELEDHRLHAAQSSAHRHELGRGPPRSQARGTLLRLGGISEEGSTLAFGTDYPVEPVTPFRGLYAAVTRKSEDGKKEYYPEQKLNIEQAIAAYTTGSAFAEFAEKEKGTLAPGMLADMVVLDRDITVRPAGEDSQH